MQRYLQRLWEKDMSLWGSDPAVQASVRNRLGWLTMPKVMTKETASLRAFAQEVRQAGLTHALLLGMGGSGLFSEVCQRTFGAQGGGLGLTVLDTTDARAILAAQQRVPLKQLLVIVSSKSGSTSEVSALSKYFYDVFKSSDQHPGQHCLVITDQGTPLEEQAKAWKVRRLFVHGPQNGADVGGRFSALTYFGLVPAALLGLDLDRLLVRAQEMATRCGPSVPLMENPAAQLGTMLGTLAAQGNDKMTLLCSPSLASFGTWAEQLVAESTGKLGKGIAPLYGEPLFEPEAYSRDRVFIELQLASEVDAKLEQLTQRLMEMGHPVIRIQWKDRYDLGGEVMKWALATTIAGSLLDINPFDEPNVQESKDRTKELLAQYTRDGCFAQETPTISDGVIALYGTVSSQTRTIAQGLNEWFERLRPTEYVTLLSFLPRSQSLDAVVTTMRERIGRSLNQATMLGIGPRYLHSTGQLYKGGPDAGIFFLLTADDTIDLPIPGEPFTFSVLKYAQAIGDFQAMQQKGRRILRVHLSGDLDRAASQLLGALDEALASWRNRPS